MYDILYWGSVEYVSLEYFYERYFKTGFNNEEGSTIEISTH